MPDRGGCLRSISSDRSLPRPHLSLPSSPVGDALAAGDVRSGQQIPVAVWDALSTVGDPRRRRGLRHRLATVLVVAFAAVLGDARSLTGIAEWAVDLPQWAWPRLRIRRRPPSLSTVRRLLLVGRRPRRARRGAARLVDGDRLIPAAFRAVAVDGKSCRGGRTADGPRVHLFSIVDPWAWNFAEGIEDVARLDAVNSAAQFYGHAGASPAHRPGQHVHRVQ